MANDTKIKARPTRYKGIQMRSRLEADYAAYLDGGDTPQLGCDWEYEPECFAGPEGQWLPDFGIKFGEDLVEYVEVKPIEIISYDFGEGIVDRIDAILKKMTVAWLSKPEARLTLMLWKYKEWDEEDQCFIQASGDNRVWIFGDAGARSPLYALWPGMGQLERLKRPTVAGGGEQ
jgi:hypothetical protein